ncbi:hypothetical protein [Devosia naphthalenivorans]|uniref:hypothetical protein n=1 Tax=Devosia naphthalenivorans TaxID=2082392 RepID=UPI000D33E259|nr:hypothetical protein [Devosia naphthalenivorans]
MPIAARYHDSRDRVLAAVDKAFAEPVRLSFFKKDLPDPLKQPVDIEAVLRVGGGDETNLAGGYAQTWRTQLAAGKAELHINAARNLGLVIKVGDRVQAISRPGEPWFKVERVDDRGENRLVLELSEL